MARPLRQEFPGAVWYVACRGFEGDPMLRDDTDRNHWLDVVAATAEAMRWKVLAYALVPSRFELLVETPEANLSAGMRQINGMYTQAYNRRWDRSGTLFQGRFKSVLVERGSFLLAAARAVVLMPLQEGKTRKPLEYRWSSARATAGAAEPAAGLDVRPILDLFDPRNRKRAVERYRDYVMEGRTESPLWDQVRQQSYLGSDEFSGEVGKKLRGGPRKARAASSSVRPDLRSIVREVAAFSNLTEKEVETGHGGEARLLVAYLGRHDAGQSLMAVGRALRLRNAAVSRLARDGREREASDPAFAARVQRIRKRLSK